MESINKNRTDAATLNQSRLAAATQRLLGGFQLSDILHAGHHSRDFSETRSDYICKRLRFMLLFFVVAVPAWIPVDYLTLEAENFTAVAIARLGLAATLLVFLLAARFKPRPLLIHSLLVATITASAAFYLAAMIIMSSGVTETPLAGYSAMPLMMIALTGLFPVTIGLGAGLAIGVAATYLGLQVWNGSWYSTETWNTLWVIGLVTGVTLWIQAGQLLMLLKLYRESTRDALTGLINRRVLMKQFDLQREAATERNELFSVLMCDLDRFKRINDNHGHLMGDEVLKRAAVVLQNTLRKEDVIARFGGEEFMAVLPATTGGEARRLAELVRKQFEDCEVTTPEGEPIPITTSIGLTTFQPGEPLEDLLERADQLLYRAKQQGRNQVMSDEAPVWDKTA